MSQSKSSAAVRRSARARRAPSDRATAAVALEDARRAGLLDGRTQHLSFRAPAALVEAAMREAQVKSPTQLGVAALAMLAQPDPVAAYFKESFGRLGADFDLDY